MSVISALRDALGEEFAAWHLRLRALFEQADPRTTDEMLADWERAWGLPDPCGTLPATDAGRRELLSGKVASFGGQSRAYFIGVARIVLGDPAADVTIEELPDGSPFRVSINRVGDRLNAVGALFYWIIHLPSTTTASQEDAVDCLAQKYKPAHTVVTVEVDP